MIRARTFGTARRLLAVAAFAAVIGATAGCAAQSVGAYRREHLADPIMSYNAEAKRDARRVKALEAREGSTGGIGGEGGGCACK